MITVEEAKNLVVVVSTDPEASKRIDSNIDGIVPASWGIAGGLRNAGYVALGMITLGKLGDPTDAEYANRVCTGISDAASAAINKAITRQDARVRTIKIAMPVSRILNGTDHTAVQIDVLDGQQHVIDWHATLDAGNPMMFESPAKWVLGQGGIPLSDFHGWK